MDFLTVGILVKRKTVRIIDPNQIYIFSPSDLLVFIDILTILVKGDTFFHMDWLFCVYKFMSNLFEVNQNGHNGKLNKRFSRQRSFS